MKTEFHFMFYKTFQAQQKHFRKDMLQKMDLSSGQPKVLRYVSMHKDCKLKDIAVHCNVEPATVSKILNDLEQKGMLVRVSLLGDKRALSLSITEKGMLALTKWKAQCAEVEQRSLAGFSEEEQKQFEEYLCRMYFNLTENKIDEDY